MGQTDGQVYLEEERARPVGCPDKETLLRSPWSIMGSHWSPAACSDQIQNRPTRVMEFWV